jgi:hypothetical protein
MIVRKFLSRLSQKKNKASPEPVQKDDGSKLATSEEFETKEEEEEDDDDDDEEEKDTHEENYLDFEQIELTRRLQVRKELLNSFRSKKKNEAVVSLKFVSPVSTPNVLVAFTPLVFSDLERQELFKGVILDHPEYANVVPNWLLPTCLPAGWGLSQNFTLLHHAAIVGDRLTCETLINAGANPHQKNFHGQTPLQLYPCLDRKQFIRHVERDRILLIIAQASHARLGRKSKWKRLPTELWNLIYDWLGILNFKQYD